MAAPKHNHKVRTKSQLNKLVLATLAAFVIAVVLPEFANASAGYAFAAFNVGTLTGGGAAFTKSLDVSGVTNTDYLFVCVTAAYVSGAAPHDAWSSTMHLQLGDGITNIYWPTNIPTSGAMNQDSTNTIIWSGPLPGVLYHGGSNLTVKFVDTYNDPQQGPTTPP